MTILTIDNDSLNVIAVGGDPHLGGKDFDDRIMNFIEDELKEKYGFEMESDASLEAELRLKAEAAKRQLTARNAVPITLKVKRSMATGSGTMDTFIPVRIELTREIFEQTTADLLTRTEMLLDSVMEQGGLTWNDISETLCVGGSSRMPMVREMLTRLSGRRPLLHDPDECVAKGAALQAALIAKDDTVAESERRSCAGAFAGCRDRERWAHHRRTRHSIVDAAALLAKSRRLHHDVRPAKHGADSHLRRRKHRSGGVFQRANRRFQSGRDAAAPKRPAEDFSRGFAATKNGRIMALARDRDTGKESRSFIALDSARNKDEIESEELMLSSAVIS